MDLDEVRGWLKIYAGAALLMTYAADDADRAGHDGWFCAFVVFWLAGAWLVAGLYADADA